MAVGRLATSVNPMPSCSRVASSSAVTVRATSPDFNRMKIFWMLGNFYVTQDRSPFLRHANHVEHGAALSLKVRGHANKCADRNYASPSDSCNQDFGRSIGQRQFWSR